VGKSAHSKKWKTIVLSADDYYRLKALAGLEGRKLSMQFRIIFAQWFDTRYNDADLKRINIVATDLREEMDGPEVGDVRPLQD